MADSTAPVKAAASTANKVAEKAAKDVPSVVAETVEVGMSVPSKVVLNQRAVVAVSILSGAALALAGVATTNFLKRKRNAKKAEAETEEVKAPAPVKEKEKTTQNETTPTKRTGKAQTMRPPTA